jgi:hypothetical protein
MRFRYRAPQLPRPRPLGRLTRVAAGLVGSFFTASFIYTGLVPHFPLISIGLGCTSVWFIQAARTGVSQNWNALLWFAGWYAFYSLSWHAAEAVTTRPIHHRLPWPISYPLFFGSVVAVLVARMLVNRRRAVRRRAAA